MRAIDGDALKEQFKDKEGDTFTAFHFYEAIDKMPTIEERRTGKWVHGREIWREHIGDAIISIGYENWRCSECGALVKDEATKVLWKYCPWCGAKMEGSKEE